MPTVRHERRRGAGEREALAAGSARQPHPQSHRNPDGTGLGIFDAEGRPVVHKAPISAFTDTSFASEARKERSRTFLAHVRFASTGAKTLANTHPFDQDGRLFAHNGVLAGLPQLDEELGDDRALVHGETDSERLFAMITREIRRHDGDIHAGIVAGASWIAENLPIYSLNLIITTAAEVFALSYPDTNTLYVLERGAGGVGGEEALHHHSSLGTRVHCVQAAQRPVVVLATSRWTRTLVGAPYNQGSCSMSAPSSRSAPRSCFQTRRLICWT